MGTQQMKQAGLDSQQYRIKDQSLKSLFHFTFMLLETLKQMLKSGI